MAVVSYVVGDATEPVGPGPKIIVHICNDVGAWGAGFVLAISKKWPAVRDDYRSWLRTNPVTSRLGQVQLVRVAADLWVANLIGQRDVRWSGGRPPIRYEAVEEGLRTVAVRARELGATIHMPRIGCGLAGGEWSQISPFIQRRLIEAGVSVTVYDYMSAPAQYYPV